jgi:ABC-type uncharacterized transport system involved in gliding motility auxiliary subunit
MKRKTRELLVTLLVTICLALVLADSARWFVRLDLTRNAAYSISPVSRAIILGIPQQVHITYYLSDRLRSLSPAVERIVDLAQEYAAQSRGKVLLTVVDPDRTGQGERARAAGILPQQIQVVQQNEQRTIDVYSGIAIDYLDRYTSLPAVFTPDGLEYSLSFAVRKLLSGRRLVVGIIIGEPEKTLAGDYESLRTGLSRDYSLHELLPGEAIPPGVDALMVLGGTRWGEPQLRPIDAYLRAGGRVLFAVKGLRVSTAGSLAAAPVGPSPLLSMIGSYGVRVGSDMVLDTACRDYRLPQQGQGGQVAWETIGPYPPWVSLRSPNVSATHPVTASFAGLDLLWPVALSAQAPEGVLVEALASSSASSWLQGPPFVVNPYKVAQGPPQGERPGRQVLAYALSGTFPAAFPGDAPSAPTRMIVIGDDDFLTDLVQFSDSLPNVLFAENAVLWLSGNADLLSIKTRAAAEGRLDRVQDPRARGRLMLLSELLNVAAIPLLVLVFGVIRTLRRRDRRAP